MPGAVVHRAAECRRCWRGTSPRTGVVLVAVWSATVRGGERGRRPESGAGCGIHGSPPGPWAVPSVSQGRREISAGSFVETSLARLTLLSFFVILGMLRYSRLWLLQGNSSASHPQLRRCVLGYENPVTLSRLVSREGMHCGVVLSSVPEAESHPRKSETEV